MAMERTLAGLEAWPINIGLQAGARADEDAADLDALLEAGAIGFKIHEDYGAYPELIDAVARVRRRADGIAVSLHTDGLHESAELEDTVAAIGGRTVHAYHVEGTGGGHVPDLLGLVREANVLCSSTTPTLPFGVNAPAEHVPMIVLNHGGSWACPATSSWSGSASTRRRWPPRGRSTSWARSGSSTPTRRGWAGSGDASGERFSLPTSMKRWRRDRRPAAGLPGLPATSDDPRDDNERVLRYLAKITIEPAIMHGDRGARSARSGRGGWPTSCSGSRRASGSSPSSCSRPGCPAWGAARRGQRVGRAGRADALPAGLGRAAGRGAAAWRVTFAAPGAAGALRRRAGAGRDVVVVGRTRGLTRADLHANRATAPIEIDPRDGRVTLAGRPLAVEPVADVPLSRRYFLR